MATTRLKRIESCITPKPKISIAKLLSLKFMAQNFVVLTKSCQFLARNIFIFFWLVFKFLMRSDLVNPFLEKSATDFAQKLKIHDRI